MNPTLEQAIGQNVARLRKRKDLNQTELGKILGDVLGKPWQRQSVWAAENGKRSFTAVDLIGLASALEVTVQELLTVDEAVAAGSSVFSPDEVIGLTAGEADTVLYERIFHTAADVKNSMKLSENLYAGLIRDVRRVAKQNSELRAKVRGIYEKYEETALRDAAAFDVEPRSREELLPYMPPVMVAAMDVLEGLDDGEGN